MTSRLTEDELHRLLGWLVDQHIPQGDTRCADCGHAPSHHRPMCTWPMPVGPSVPLCDCAAFTQRPLPQAAG